MSENQFKHTPYGDFYAKDIESLYAFTIISLNLSPKCTKSSTGSVSWFQKGHSFSFTIEDAKKVMTAMTLEINNGKTKTNTTIRCGVKLDKVVMFLKIFIEAHLLHCASDRTKIRVKDGDLLQPTPKGLNLVQRFCQRIDYKSKSLETLLLSAYNSMALIAFDRRINDDRIVQSRTFTHLLFKRIMGPIPNVYNPNDPPHPIAANTKATIYGDTVDYSLYSPLDREFPESVKSMTWGETLESPFFHRFYSHPGSTAVCQYYTNVVGVRVFQEKQFPVAMTNSRSKGLTRNAETHSNTLAVLDKHDSITYHYCFTGKALGQWMMDCTDVMSNKEVVELLVQFLQEKLIEPIVLGKSISTMTSMVLSPDAYYAINTTGLRLCQWPEDVKDYLIGMKRASMTSAGSSSDSSSSSMEGLSPEIPSQDQETFEPHSNGSLLKQREDVKLETLLEDAGLNLLFRIFLEKNRCQENLLFYSDMDHLNYNYELFQRRKALGSTKHMDMSAEKLLSVVYAIYNRYFKASAPHELNVSPELGKKLHEILFEDTANITGAKHILPIGAALSTVDAALPVLIETKKTVYRIMSSDSMPKFLDSEDFLETIRDTRPDIGYHFIKNPSY